MSCGADTTYRKICICGAAIRYVAPGPRPKPPLESTIKARIRAAVIDAGCLCWVHNVDNRNLHTGLGLGTSDLICVAPGGRFLAIEVKRPGGKPNENQKRFLAAVRHFGGVSGIATNAEEALALVAEAKHGAQPDAQPDADR